LELPATNIAEGFDSHGHALIGDTSTSFNSPSYTRNGFSSIDTQYLFDPAQHYTGGHPQPQENLFYPAQYYTGGHPQPQENLFDPAEHYIEGHLSFNTLSQQSIGNTGFTISSHQHDETSNFDIQSPENLFDPADFYIEGHPSFNTLSQQQSNDNTGFNILDHRHHDTSLDTISRESI